MHRKVLSSLFKALSVVAIAAVAAAPALAQNKKPNILVIWGDDIGQFNISAYNRGMMGYKTPNIDRIASEGALFTDWYGQQSCTAGRAAFITGQSPIRTGLTKVGLPGAPEGMRKEDPTIATLLKAQGYMTGQFGKNHLGDRDEMLPTNHAVGRGPGQDLQEARHPGTAARLLGKGQSWPPHPQGAAAAPARRRARCPRTDPAVRTRGGRARARP